MPDVVDTPSPSQVRAALDRLLHSRTLAASERLRQFLQLIVEETLEGRGDRLKEYVLGVEALGRPSSFDPRADPAVRIEARRLRAKLADYYAAEGADDEIEVTLPKGGYVPAFRLLARPPKGAPREAVPTDPSGTGAPGPNAGDAVPTPARRTRRLALSAAAALAIVVIGLVAWLATHRDAARSAFPTVAVLPFANVGGDAGNEYLCFGLVEDLTTALAQTPGLRVVASSSSTQAAANQDVAAIAVRLHADYVVEGSVQRSGSTLRITAQVIKAADGSHLWAKAFDRSVGDLLETQAEIARAVSDALGSRLAPPAGGRPAALDAETQELFLKGRYFVNVVDRQAPEKGLAYLRQVVERAPEYAPAHASIAAAYIKQTLDRPAPLPLEIEAARASARRAIELDPSLADAHALLAWIAFFHDWDWKAAERGFQQALALNPNSSVARHRYALLLMSTRRFDEALSMSRKATELDPLSALIASNRAMILLCARRYDEAIGQARAALELAPGGHTTRVYIGSSLAMKGQVGRALDEYRAAVAASPDDPDASASLAWGLAVAGRQDEARRLLADLVSPSRRSPASHYEIAFVRGALGDRSGALADLEESLARHETELTYLAVDPLFDSLRREPRFAAFQNRLGFSR